MMEANLIQDHEIERSSVSLSPSKVSANSSAYNNSHPLPSENNKKNTPRGIPLQSPSISDIVSAVKSSFHIESPPRKMDTRGAARKSAESPESELKIRCK